MRLFTGLDLPAEVVRNLEKLLEELRPTARIQWSPPANLHITTKFIGEWPEERLDELKSALAGVPGRAGIPLHIHKVGFFPNPHSPRVFWCGIEAPGLAELAADTDRATAALGVESEKRAFSPHLTLARIKETVDLQPLREDDRGARRRSISGALRRPLLSCTAANCGPPVPCTLNLRSFRSQSDDAASCCGDRLPAGRHSVRIPAGEAGRPARMCARRAAAISARPTCCGPPAGRRASRPCCWISARAIWRCGWRAG